MDDSAFAARLAECQAESSASSKSCSASSPRPASRRAQAPHRSDALRDAWRGEAAQALPDRRDGAGAWANGQGSEASGAAIECIHAYSLIHDDLPSMDDDDLRRGRPTTHRAFDEATAILAGDALQTLAFEILADPATDASADVRVALCLGLARAAGLAGMVGGQMLDIDAERRTAPLSVEEIKRLQAMKTGALLKFSVEAGAILAGAGASARAALGVYGRAIGAAFQIADDILDVESDAATLGKRAGKDAAQNKGTLVGALGLDGARRELERLVEEAIAAVDAAGVGLKGDVLRATARFVALRKN